MTPPLRKSVDPPVEQLNRSLRLLANEPRRRIIAELLDRSDATWIALPEAIWTPDLQVTREKLVIALHHHHLPTLADAEYVRWRSDPLEVGRGPNFDQVGALVEVALRNVDDIPCELVQGNYHLAMRADQSEI